MNRSYIRLPLVLDASVLEENQIEQVIQIFESELKGSYRFSKESVLGVLQDHLEKTKKPFSWSKSYLSVIPHRLGFNAISALDNISDLGGTVVSFEQLLEYQSSGKLKQIA